MCSIVVNLHLHNSLIQYSPFFMIYHSKIILFTSEALQIGCAIVAKQGYRHQDFYI